MEVLKRYLVIEKDSKTIREWECLEISTTAFKVQDLVGGVSESLFYSGPTIGKPYWVLMTDVDTIGQTKFKIIDELQKR
jgi:hypothetical protein